MALLSLQDLVAGQKFFAKDFDMNVVKIYHHFGGTPPPRRIPFWILQVLVFISMAIAIFVHKVFCKTQILDAKNALHDGALDAGLQLTVVPKLGTEVLGYREFVPRSTCLAQW